MTAAGLEDADQCKIGSWSTGGADFSVTIGCFDHAGNPADHRFDMLFVWWRSADRWPDRGRTPRRDRVSARSLLA